MLYVTYFRPSDPNIGILDCGGYEVHPTQYAALEYIANDAENHGSTYAADAAEAAAYAAAAAAFRAAKNADDFRRPSRWHHAYTIPNVGDYIAEAAHFHTNAIGGRITLTMHPAIADMIADALNIIGDDDAEDDANRTYTADTAYDAAEALRREVANAA